MPPELRGEGGLYRGLTKLTLSEMVAIYTSAAGATESGKRLDSARRAVWQVRWIGYDSYPGRRRGRAVQPGYTAGRYLDILARLTGYPGKQSLDTGTQVLDYCRCFGKE